MWKFIKTLGMVTLVALVTNSVFFNTVWYIQNYKDVEFCRSSISQEQIKEMKYTCSSIKCEQYAEEYFISQCKGSHLGDVIIDKIFAKVGENAEVLGLKKDVQNYPLGKVWVAKKRSKKLKPAAKPRIEHDEEKSGPSTVGESETTLTNSSNLGY